MALLQNTPSIFSTGMTCEGGSEEKGGKDDSLSSQLTFMGSHGDSCLRCSEYGRCGKCSEPEYLPPDVPALWDFDGYEPYLLCDLCYDGAYPHLTLRFLRGKFPKGVTDLIESLAYPEWARMPPSYPPLPPPLPAPEDGL